MALQEDINNLGRILETTDENLVSILRGIEATILSRVLRLLKNLDSSRGKLIKNRITARLVRLLSKEIKEIIDKSKYVSKVSKYLEVFDDVEDLTVSTISEINNLKISKSGLSTEKSESIKALSRRLTSVNSIEDNIIQPIKDILFSALRKGGSVSETEAALRQLIKGQNNKGFLQKYSRQVATDAVMGYQGKIQTVISEQYELNAFRYVGSLIATSRQTCRDLINGTGEYADLAQGRGVYLIKDIPKIIERSKDNSGWNPATTEANFFELRGGFNCRHRALPFRLNNKSASKKVDNIKIQEKKKDR